VPTAGTISASAGSPAGAAASGGIASAGNGAAGVSGSASAAGSGASSAPACTGMPLSAGDHEYMIDSKNGIKYSYILSIPKTVDPMQRAPLILHWHALTSDPEEARSLTSIDAKAEAAKAIVVYPRSPDKSWDTGSCCLATSGGKARDEEVFARELVKDVVSKACVDGKRIYTNGFSNGGMMSQLLACRMGDVFAAVAPMGSTLTIDEATCKPSRPIPMFLINGTADPLVGYDSPSFAGGLTVPADIKFWAEKNKCTGEPEMFLQMGKVTCKRYTQCGAGVELSFCAVEGMGHCVPGMKKESATNCLTKSIISLGPPNDDIDAMQMNVDFLMRFSLP
jgi:polyhydroxybutyrate depolymerase